MGLAVVGLIGLVLWLASKSPGVSVTAKVDGSAPSLGALGPDMNLPSLGATDKFAPSLTGGMPLIARDNRTRLNTQYMNARQRQSRAVVADPPKGSQTGILGGLTDASASGTFKLENPPPLTVRPAIYIPNPASKLQRFKF